MRYAALDLELSARHALQGVPTTRAGSVVTSEDRVVRDLLYTGNPVRERCSVVSRIAPSFLRFGSFEIFKPVDPTTGAGRPATVPLVLLTHAPCLATRHRTQAAPLTARHADGMRRA